jgi:NADH-quinone oxidoreductase subunit N
MNAPLIILEFAVIGLGLALLLLSLWASEDQQRNLGYVAILALGLILAGSFLMDASRPMYAFGRMFVLDEFALFFKRFFLVAALMVLVLSMNSTRHLTGGTGEYYAFILFALSGMMVAASANHFALLFVSLELITVTFYILTGYRSHRVRSLEAGIKYLIMGGLSSAFLVYGMALVYGTSGVLGFDALREQAAVLGTNRVFLAGLILILTGLAFKIAVVPFQMWTPDVYQGAPTPTAAFLAVGSKAAGFAVLLRLLFFAVPEITLKWKMGWLAVAVLTVLYGNLCAIPQRNLSRLMGYSSIANAGYLMLGLATVSRAGVTAMLFYLGVYLFAVLAVFTVLGMVLHEADTDDLDALAALNRRSPLLALTLAVAMASLAGVPLLAGFFGKFLVIKAVVSQFSSPPYFQTAMVAAVLGILASMYYYFGVIKAAFWGRPILEADAQAVALTLPVRWAVYFCLAGMVGFGLFPGWLLRWAEQAAGVFPWH